MRDQMMATTTKRGNAEQSQIRARYRAHCAVEVDRFSHAQGEENAPSEKRRPKRADGEQETTADNDIDYDFYLSD